MRDVIRILRIVPNMHSGGLENHIMNIYRHIDREKVQFDFLTHYEKRCIYDDEIEALGGKIYRLTVREDHNIIKYLIDLNNFFKNHGEYKIIHGHMASLASAYFLIAKRNGINILIAHSHNSSTERTLKGFLKKLLIKPVKYITDYRYACSTVAGKFLFGKKPFTLTHNALEIEKFDFNPVVRSQVRNSLGIENKFVIGHIGRFNLQKNHEFVIDIFENVYEKDKNTTLLLVGSGELEQKIKQRVKGKGLEKAVIFLGVRNDVNKLYQAMDLFLLPSFFEGMPNVAIEAQTAGLQVILSDTITEEVGITDLVQFVSLKESPEFWAERIMRYSNGYIRKSMGDAIKSAHYDIKTEAAIWQSFYMGFYQGI